MCAQVDLACDLRKEDVLPCSYCRLSKLLLVACKRLIDEYSGTTWPCKRCKPKIL